MGHVDNPTHTWDAWTSLCSHWTYGLPSCGAGAPLTCCSSSYCTYSHGICGHPHTDMGHVDIHTDMVHVDIHTNMGHVDNPFVGQVPFGLAACHHTAHRYGTHGHPHTGIGRVPTHLEETNCRTFQGSIFTKALSQYFLKAPPKKLFVSGDPTNPNIAHRH